ncbi:hypothetical protein [Allokutzneria oryzae]|uniref:Uncharacterized protein n=1 Tax=Allokutzneria oryzae TaxID=1378989 RepID=A0ABV5ZRT5_9PSEU
MVGSADVSQEISVIQSYFFFWQYKEQADCATVPKAGAPEAYESHLSDLLR